MRAWDEKRDKHVKIFLNALEDEFPNEDPLFMDFRPYGYVPPLPTKDYTLDPHVYFGRSKFTPPTVELTFHDFFFFKNFLEPMEAHCATLTWVREHWSPQ